MRLSPLTKFIVLCAPIFVIAPSAHATWLGILGIESAKTVQKTSKKETSQTETILQGVNLDLGGFKIDNTTAAKWNSEGAMSVARNWSYGYWNDNHGVSLDLIKGDFSGVGPSIYSIGYAYKDCWDSFCLRVNPALARLNYKGSDKTEKDEGFQLNVKMDYKVNDFFNIGFHPQYATWQDDKNGATLKLDFNATMNLGDSGKHKLMLVHEAFAVNNEATNMKTRFVGERSPVAGYVQGTESAVKLRYIYRF
ncbi:hypothetical protein [Vibrio agarivorans]|uniref:Porin n=1 Tax=Vibrio agarivorans TaxID=153622 RepID=A0ABT7XYK9_9VIBR|nr:hypothetical protein [Vibrio agarivorans]MDN2480842.1 hypothetical protein [Vibrio agarivorans]